MRGLETGERNAWASDRLDSGVSGPFECRAAFEVLQAIEEHAGEQHPALACGLGHGAVRGGDLIVRPAPVISYVRFHSLLPVEAADSPSR